MTKADLNAFKTDVYEHSNIAYLPSLSSEEINTIKQATSGEYLTLRSDVFSNAVWNGRNRPAILYVQLDDGGTGDFTENPCYMWLTPIVDGHPCTIGYINNYLLNKYVVEFEGKFSAVMNGLNLNSTFILAKLTIMGYYIHYIVQKPV